MVRFMWKNQLMKNILVHHWATKSQDHHQDYPYYFNIDIPLSEDVVERFHVRRDVEVSCPDIVLIVLRENCYIADIDQIIIVLLVREAN